MPKAGAQAPPSESEEDRPADPSFEAVPRSGSKGARGNRKPKAPRAVRKDVGIGVASDRAPGSKTKRGAPAADVDVTALVAAAQDVLAQVGHMCEVMKQGKLYSAEIALVKILATSVKAHTSPSVACSEGLTCCHVSLSDCQVGSQSGLLVDGLLVGPVFLYVLYISVFRWRMSMGTILARGQHAGHVHTYGAAVAPRGTDEHHHQALLCGYAGRCLHLDQASGSKEAARCHHWPLEDAGAQG